MNDIVILGTGGCAKELIFLIEENNKHVPKWNIKGLLGKENSSILGYPILGDDQWLFDYSQKISVICAIGNSKLRKKVISKFQNRSNLDFPSIVSEHAIVGKSCRIGKGVIVCAGAVVTEEVYIDDFAIVNMNSTIGHETYIASFATISPGVNISGNVKIGSCTEIGVGAVTIQGINIGDEVIIGAGTIVLEDVQARSTMVGNPGKVIKKYNN